MRVFGMILLLLSLIAGPIRAQVSWEQAIEQVENRGDEYYTYAIGLDPSSTPGAVLHGIGYDQNICAIIGRMLGFTGEIKEAEYIGAPELGPDADPYELMTYSLRLDSWVAAARNALSMTDSQKESLWNLECVGLHGIPADAFINDPDLVADFSINNDMLLVYGDIIPGFYDNFLEVLSNNPNITEVALGSAGGSVIDAIMSGYEIRRRGLETVLRGPCFSACPLVFAGGVERKIWMGLGPHMGFHQAYTDSGAVDPSSQVYQQIALYLTAMGIDAWTVIDWMLRAGPDELFEPDLESLCDARIATWIQRVCWS